MAACIIFKVRYPYFIYTYVVHMIGTYMDKLNKKKREKSSGVSSLGVPWHPQILADRLTLSQIMST